MVDDHDVRIFRALTHARHEALVVTRAVSSQAVLRASRHVVPERQVFGKVCNLGTVARLCAGRPCVDDGEEHPRVVRRRKSRQRRRHPRYRGLVTERLEPVQAEVVRASLHAGGLEGDAERPLQHREVLEIDLLLEVLGAGRHEDPFAPEDRRHQIGERLARAGAGLHEQHAAFLEGSRHGGRHLALTFTRFEADHCRSNRATGREGPIDGRSQRFGGCSRDRASRWDRVGRPGGPTSVRGIGEI